MKAINIGIINNKGGVGKSMTAQNLGAALALKGFKTCLIDFDSQHNLTNRYQNSSRESEVIQNKYYTNVSIEAYLLDETLPILPIEIKKNLHLIPSTIKLSEVSAALYAMKKDQNASEKLRELCNLLQPYYDFIIIDSEPGMSALMVNATKASDLIIIPVSCLDALDGAGEGVFGIMEANQLDTPYFFLQTIYESRLKSSRDIRSALIYSACENTLRTFIKRNEYLNSAGSYGQDIFEYAPKSGGANDYKDLATEIVSLLKSANKKK